MTDVAGNVTRYEYNDLGHKTAVILPDGSKQTTTYDARGNVLSQTDAEGAKTTYTYDNNNNLTIKSCPMLLTYQLKEASNMSDYNYEIIKTSVLKWYEKVLPKFHNQDKIILLKNNNDVLIIDFDFQNCIAQLSVTNSKYVPYQFVYFEAMDIEVLEEEITTIYSFYDDDSMRNKDVISALDEALIFCFNYKVK